MRALTLLIKPVSGKCNMRCSYCFYRDEMEMRKMACLEPMIPEVTEALVRRAFIYAEQAINFAFQGGEPTLAGEEYYSHFIAMVHKYNVRKIPVNYSIQTNAYKLSDSLLRLFAENGFLLGVSLDGTSHTHDRYRVNLNGQPTYNDVINSIGRIQEMRIEFNILCVVTADIAAHTEETLNALAPYQYLQFIPCLDCLDGRGGAFSLSADDYGSFLVDSFLYYKRALKRGRHLSIRQFDNYLQMLCGLPPENCAMFGRCSKNLVIESDGSVYPCDFYMLDEWYMGNVMEKSFQRMQSSEIANAFIGCSFEVAEKCRNCEWFPLCRGGCRREREELAGGKLGCNRLCTAYEKFFSTCWNDLCELAYDLRCRK